jgi:alpha-L-fucosidase
VAALELEFLAPQRFDVVVLEEAIAEGQRVGYYRVEALTAEGWRTVSWGTTIGHRKLDRIAPVTARRLRLSILHAFEAPRIGRLAVYDSAE